MESFTEYLPAFFGTFLQDLVSQQSTVQRLSALFYPSSTTSSSSSSSFSSSLPLFSSLWPLNSGSRAIVSSMHSLILLLMSFLPPAAQDVLLQVVALYNSAIYPLLFPARQILLALLSPPINFVVSTLTGTSSSVAGVDAFSPGAAVLLLILAYVSFVALNILRRQLVALIRMAVRFSMFSVLVFAGLYAWQRGLGPALQDGARLVEALVGLWGDLGREGQRVGGQRANEYERLRPRTGTGTGTRSRSSTGGRGYNAGNGWRGW